MTGLARSLASPAAPDDQHAGPGHGADLYAHIGRLVDAAPPLTSAQRDQLALILRGQHRR